MKPYGASSKKLLSNRKYGVADLTEIGTQNESEEAIVQSQDGIHVTTEVHVTEQARRK